MAEEGSRAAEYADFIESQRAFVRENKPKVDDLVDNAPKEAMLVLAKIASKMSMVNADSPPSKALYCLAQCREVLREWDETFTLITQYEKALKRVEAYDLEQARKEE